MGIYDSNGGVEQIDLPNSTIVNTLTRASLGEGAFREWHVMPQPTLCMSHFTKMMSQLENTT